MQQVLSNRRPTFLQRSASVASLVAWKERFETYAGKFRKHPSFVSYAENNLKSDMKLVKEELSRDEYNVGPENDLPPCYHEVTGYPRLSEKTPSFSQDFTALENYLKKRLTVRKKSGCRHQDQYMETAKVFQWLNELPDGDNLEEFLEAYGIPTEGVDIEEMKNKLREFLNTKLTETDFSERAEISRKTSSEGDLLDGVNKSTKQPTWQRQISDLEELAQGDNLEKWIEDLDVPYFNPIPETKEQIRNYLKLQIRDKKGKNISQPTVKVPESPPPTYEEIREFVPKWKELIDKMRDLKNEDDLEKWLESLEVPHNVPKDKVKAEIRKFFMKEEFDSFAGKSLVFQEHSLANKLWEKFEDSSTLKQVAMISGTTAVLGLIAVLSTTMLSFAFPPALAANPYFTEVFSQYFIQRQEVAFNLLNFHAENAKPLSTAWAKQYILWKYC